GRIHCVTADDFATFQIEMSKGFLANFSLQSRIGVSTVTQHVTMVGTRGELSVRGGDLVGAKEGSGEEVIHLDVEEMALPPGSKVIDCLRELPRPQIRGLCRLVGALQEAFTISPTQEAETGTSWVKDPVISAATFPEGQAVQATVEAIRRSSLEKRWVRVQIQTEEKDSNRLLSESVRRTTVSF
ncbi:unnamed protein product, partial [Cyprideis torosa]